jgi:hypothetical protein
MMATKSVYNCDECGKLLPELALGRICRPCLARRSRNVMLQYEREAWDKAQPKDVALACASAQVDKKQPRALNPEHVNTKLIHLVFSTEPDFVFCGQRAPTQKQRRRRVKLDSLPPEICTDCRAAFEHLLELCRPLWAMVGG